MILAGLSIARQSRKFFLSRRSCRPNGGKQISYGLTVVKGQPPQSLGMGCGEGTPYRTDTDSRDARDDTRAATFFLSSGSLRRQRDLNDEPQYC